MPSFLIFVGFCAFLVRRSARGVGFAIPCSTIFLCHRSMCEACGSFGVGMKYTTHYNIYFVPGPVVLRIYVFVCWLAIFDMK